MNDIEERIDDLQLKGLKLIQDKSLFCFGMDAVLLADYAKINDNAKVIDLGTGNGILPILIHGKYKAAKIVGVEIQEKSAALAVKNVQLNEIEDYVQIIKEDIKNIRNLFEKGSFDYVITNPPYKKANSGIINEKNEKAVARHEILCTLEDIISSSSYLLRDSGVFYMINRPERLADAIELMRKNKIEPKKIKFVFPYENKKPNLFLISGTKYGNQFLTVEEPLIIRKSNGDYTKMLYDIYSGKEE